MALAGVGSRLLNTSRFGPSDRNSVRYVYWEKMSSRWFSSRPGMGKLVADMTPDELVGVFLNDRSNRMEKCKAG